MTSLASEMFLAKLMKSIIACHPEVAAALVCDARESGLALVVEPTIHPVSENERTKVSGEDLAFGAVC